MVPPDDKDTEHGCEWRDFATHLQGEVAALKTHVEVLTRAFAKRSEKIGKMPRIARPPRTPAEAADRRLEQALLRADRVVTEEKLEPVPEALKKCHVCEGTSFRSVGSGKPSESYVPTRAGLIHLQCTGHAPLTFSRTATYARTGEAARVIRCSPPSC